MCCDKQACILREKKSKNWTCFTDTQLSHFKIYTDIFYFSLFPILFPYKFLTFAPGCLTLYKKPTTIPVSSIPSLI